MPRKTLKPLAAASPSSNTSHGANGHSAARPSFDIATRHALESAVVIIHDPTVLPGQAPVDTGGRIRIQSLYSVAAHEAIQRAHAALQVVDGKVELTEEQAGDSLLEQLIAATVAANDWYLTEHGQPLAADEPTVRRVYTDPRTAWIRPQVRDVYLDLARFFATGTPS